MHTLKRHLLLLLLLLLLPLPLFVHPLLLQVMAQGYESDLQQMLTWLPTGSPQADASGEEASWSVATGEFDDFRSLWTV
jgi:hypothetical protein